MLCILRAHNEERTVAAVIAALSAVPAITRVVVVASGCTDGTEAAAAAAGAEVVQAPLGLGAATVAAFEAADEAPFVLLDADLTGVHAAAISELAAVAEAGGCGRGCHDTAGRSSAQLPRIAAEVGVQLPPVAPQALTTSYTSWPARFADAVDWSTFPADRGGDLTLALLACDAGFRLVEVHVGPRAHMSRDDVHIARLVAANTATLARYAGMSQAERSD